MKRAPLNVGDVISLDEQFGGMKPDDIVCIYLLMMLHVVVSRTGYNIDADKTGMPAAPV